MPDYLQNALRDTDTGRPVRIGEILTDAYAGIERMAQSRKHAAGIPTGFTDLDRILNGLNGGELIVVGARPAMGKTSFVLNVVSHAAIRFGKSVALFCPGIFRSQVALRILCSAARADLQKVRRGEMNNELRRALENAMPSVSSAPIYIDDTPCPTPGMIGSRCRKLKRENKLDLIVIDHLGLIRADEEAGSRDQEADAVFRALKAIAGELDVPVLLGAQLARPGKDRADRYPILKDLGGTGMLEREADVILLLHRENYYAVTPKEQETCDVIVSGRRNGPPVTVRLAWQQKYASFADLSAEEIIF